MRRYGLMLLLALGLAGCQQHATPNNCQALSGVWQGTYYDPTGLFQPKPFPLKLVLQSEGDLVVGYTLPAQDENGARYGSQSPYLFTAVCQNNQLTQMTMLPVNASCGGRTQASVALHNSDVLTFPLHWENAMTSTEFAVTLSRQYGVTKSTNTVNTDLINEANKLATQSIKTCT